MKKQNPRVKFALNGLSVHTLTLSQDGDLEVEFDLPQPQTTDRWHTYLRGSRTLDVYDDDELKEACGQLFQIVRDRVMQPDPECAEIHCDTCETSACCRQYNVLLRDEDINRLAAHLEISASELSQRYTKPAVDWCGDFARQLACDEDEDEEEKCVFLKQDDVGRWRCSVYEHRPQICRDFDMASCDDFVAMEDVTTLQD